MASDHTSTTVTIVAIMILLALGGIVAYRMGAFGNGGDTSTTLQDYRATR